MKGIVQEVVFAAYGDWKIEAYAWCKELARRLHARFLVVQSQPANAELAQKLLQGDGYYFSHYNYAPVKTHISSKRGELSQTVISYLNSSENLAILVFDLRPKTPPQHMVLTIPATLNRATQESEFIDILRQISILNLPFNIVEEEQSTWLSKFLQNIRMFL